MCRKCYLLVISLFCTFYTWGQENTQTAGLLKKAGALASANYDSALVLTGKAIELSQKQNDAHGLAEGYKLKGYCLYFKGNYPGSLEFYQKAEKLAEEKGFSDILLSLHNLVGTFYKKQNRPKEALKEFKAGENLAAKLNDAVNVANFKNDVGLVYEIEEKLPDAIKCFKEALAIFKEHGNKDGMSYSLDYLGEAYANEGNFKEALACMLQCLDLRKSAGEQAPLAINLNNIGEIHILQKNYGAALPYLQESEKISARLKYSDLHTHTLGLIAKCYYQASNYKDAYDVFERGAQIKDSIYNEKNARLINEMEARYQNEKKELQIENLNRQNELKEEKLSKQKITLVAVLLVALLCAGGVIFVIRSNRRIRRAHEIISRQKHLVEEKQKEILDSIYYARRIQRSLLTAERYIDKHLTRLQKR